MSFDTGHDVSYNGRHSLSFREAVNSTAKMEASDPRDKVYALLSTLHPEEACLLTPDYRKPYQQVFAEATYACSVGSCSFEILAQIVREWTPDPNLPSWTVDFTKCKQLISGSTPSYDRFDRAGTILGNDGMALQVTGILDRIHDETVGVIAKRNS